MSSTAIVPPRFTSHLVHPCGCETRWNVDLWRSEATRRCFFHEAVEAEHNGRTGEDS